MNRDSRLLNSAWWALRIGLGLGPFLAGLDKFFNVLTDWSMYLSPWVVHLLPISGPAFMRVVGVIEMIVGLAILTSWTRIGSYVAAGWLVAIALNLLTTGMFYDLAVRDLEIAIGAYTLARLTEVRRIVPEMSQRRHASALPVLLLATLSMMTVPAAAAESWKNVPIVDTQCAPKVKGDPDAHTTACALQCSKHGFGIITADGSFLLLDDAGNKKAVAALKATDKTDHLHATVTGDRQGDTIKVTSLSLEK